MKKKYNRIDKRMTFLLTKWKDTYGRVPKMDLRKKNVRISDIKSGECV